MGKNLARQYFKFQLMFVIDYNNQLIVVQRKTVCKSFVKDNQNQLLGIDPMGLSAPRSDSLEIIALYQVKIDRD